MLLLRHSCMSAAKETKGTQHTSVLFTGSVKSPNSAFDISNTTKLISTKFICFLLYIFTTSHIKIERIGLAFLEIFIPENRPIFFTFFFFSQNYK